MDTQEKTYQCSVCNNQLIFKKHTNYANCTLCTNVLYKNNEDKLEAKLIKTIKTSSTPIQIGTTGQYNGDAFEVIGKIRITLTYETVTIFTIAYQQNNIGFITDYAGVYGIATLHELNQEQIIVANGPLEVNNSKFPLKLNNLLCTNIQYSEKIEVDGNFYAANIFDSLKIITFHSDSLSKVKIIQGAVPNTHFLIENFVAINDLLLQNINNKIENNVVPCALCNTPIPIIDIENTISIGCNNCKSNLLYQNGRIKKFGANETTNKNIYFSIGDILNFYENNYVVTGICIKQDFTIYKSKWREYCLYNKEQGYLFLNEFDGHWIIVNRLYSNANTAEDYEIIYLDGKKYELYNNYSYKTIYVEGCFPYNVSLNKNLTCLEYIAPPLMVIKEEVDGTFNWFAAKHVSKKELQKQCSNNLPYTIGIGAIQDKAQSTTNAILLVALFCLLFAVLVQFLTVSNKTNQVIHTEYYNFPDSTNTVLYTLNNVALRKSSSNIDIEIEAAVNNSWFELSAELINNNTGEKFNVEQGIELYKGYEEGEYWSEGSNAESVTLSKVPEGIYTLNITGMQAPGVDRIKGFSILILYDTTISRNFIITFISILVLAGLALLRNYYVNVRRWKNSPYFESKYPTSTVD